MKEKITERKLWQKLLKKMYLLKHLKNVTFKFSFAMVCIIHKMLVLLKNTMDSYEKFKS